MIGRGDREAGGRGEQPVQAAHFNAGVLQASPDIAALGRRHAPGIVAEGERSDFEAAIAEASPRERTAGRRKVRGSLRCTGKASPMILALTANWAFVSLHCNVGKLSGKCKALSRQYWPTVALFVSLLAVSQFAVSFGGIREYLCPRRSRCGVRFGIARYLDAHSGSRPGRSWAPSSWRAWSACCSVPPSPGRRPSPPRSCRSWCS